MMPDERLRSAARSIASLAPAVSGLDDLTAQLADIERAGLRGYFTPDEDERIRARFARYLTARAGLLQTIDELRPIAFATGPMVNEEVQLRAFVLAYTAAALLTRAARAIVERIATDRLVQRKLNEAEPRYGIPRKQFTVIYKALTHPMTGWHLRRARRFIDEHREQVEAMAMEAEWGAVMRYLREAEPALDLPKRALIGSHLRYRWHSLRRRRASAVAHSMFGIFELAGRIIAELRNPFHVKRVTPETQRQLGAILQPGDVIISRHDDAMNNLFLPGYWIHASLHIGPESARQAMDIRVDAGRAMRWIDPVAVLEARKDGVLFRALSDTLSVDAVAVIRPKLPVSRISEALSRAITHEGKLYDFAFDFFRSDRLVCTEVVYRAFDGVGPMRFDLAPRAGRPTLSAEDLLAMALEDRGFEPVAVFGTRRCTDHLVLGAHAKSVLAETLHRGGAAGAAAGV
jgi:hypothetical protein